MKKTLWLKLKNYQFDEIVPPGLLDHVAEMFGGDDASARAFASKLARKLGWSPRFAMRAIEEYKKFVYLGTVGDASVTPSKIIDQVWHEHLLFSRAYREFCRDVLGRDFDHNPELVPMGDQTEAFEAQYFETLDAYRAEFNTEPPADIWSTPKFKPTGSIDRRSSTTRKARPDRWADDTPLFAYFDGSLGASNDMYPEFGGGDFGGGGAGRDWNSSDGGTGVVDSGADGSSDSGDAGGSGDSGGSGCSSSCGGGCSSD